MENACLFCVQVSTTPFNVDQLADSMNSITFDQAALNSEELVTGNAQKTGFMLTDYHLTDHLLVSNGHHDVGGPGQTGQIMFNCVNTDDHTPVSQTPMTVASTPQASIFTVQSPLANGFYTATRLAAPNDGDIIEPFGCFDFQDMIVSDNF